MRLFQCEEFARLFVRFPVNADIGNRIHPVAGRSVQCVQAGRQLQAVEEILLYVPDTGFHTAFGENRALQIVEVSAQEFSLSHTLFIL